MLLNIDPVDRGGDANDVLLAHAGDDRLFGGDGEDRLAAGNGTDVLRGGNGIDTAVFTHARSAYTIETSGSGALILRRGGDTTSVVDVEFLRFSDGTFGISEVVL
ncbi:MAG TPA: hypothetical protein PKA13_21370 [Geminicoccaceae bacterium]|nr:hypothetical protein [Geminicoccus sp.]HMU52344.1 hypothetical protein [Geminicoccaceae bacterium]